MNIADLTHPKAPFTVASVYGLVPNAPAGFVFTEEFRPPVAGDLFLHSWQAGHVVTAKINYGGNEPRLIVRKLTTKVVTFRSTGENRLPLRGEWYPQGEQFYQAGADHRPDRDRPRSIYTRSVTEE